MKPTLVTGADGFIGSHLAEALLARGRRVRALCMYNSFGSLGNLEGSPWLGSDALEVVSGDVRDPDFMRRATEGVGTVFHLAALIGIPYSYAAPDSYVETNVKGTLNVCQAAMAAGVDRLLVTSTSEVYGTALYVPIDEGHPRQPQSPYSASKIGADAIALSFFHAYGLPVSVVRPFNTYGPRQSARAFIPTVISQIASGAKQIKVGNLAPTRDFNFVADTVEGFLAVADCPEAVGLDFNIATGRDVSMADTLAAIMRLMDAADVEVVADEARFRPEGSEVMRLCGDASRLRELTDWSPAHSLEEGLRETVRWFAAPARLASLKPNVYNL